MNSEAYLQIVKRISEQIEEALTIELKNRLVPKRYNKIIISGMGGSSIVGRIIQSYLWESSIPVFVSRDYNLQKFADPDTLVFAISYSGNTEETLSSLKTAYSKGCQTIGVTSGGKMLKKFLDSKEPYLKVPPNLQPRASLIYQLVPILKVLGDLRIIKDPRESILNTAKAFKKESENYNEQARSLADKLIGKIPLIYSSERMSSVAYRWKTQFNENSKIHSFSNSLPELNHNEIVGYSNLNGDYHVIFLEDQRDHPRIKERMKLTRKIISEKDIPSTHMVLRGDSFLASLLSAVHVGDLTSVYLAELTNTDPEAVEVIEQLKKSLKRVHYF